MAINEVRFSGSGSCAEDCLIWHCWQKPRTRVQDVRAQLSGQFKMLDAGLSTVAGRCGASGRDDAIGSKFIAVAVSPGRGLE